VAVGTDASVPTAYLCRRPSSPPPRTSCCADGPDILPSAQLAAVDTLIRSCSETLLSIMRVINFQSTFSIESGCKFVTRNIGNFYFSFTNLALSMLLTLGFVVVLCFIVTKKGGGKSVPNALQSLVEQIYDFVLNLINKQIGGLSGNVKQKFFPHVSHLKRKKAKLHIMVSNCNLA
jgi:hypothetical protein